MCVYTDFELYMGEICEGGFIERIGHFFWDFESLFLAIYEMI